METILNYALNNAIKQCDINMVQLCLENAVLITNESIEIQQFAETVKNLENHDEVGSMLLYESSIVHPHNDNYKILLNNGFDIYICPTLIKLLNLQHTSRFYIRYQIKRLLDFGINIYNYQPEILNFYKNYIDKNIHLSYDLAFAAKIFIKHMKPSRNEYMSSYNILLNQYMSIKQIPDLTQSTLTNYSGITDISNYIIEYYKYIIKTNHNNCVMYLEYSIYDYGFMSDSDTEIEFGEDVDDSSTKSDDDDRYFDQMAYTRY